MTTILHLRSGASIRMAVTPDDLNRVWNQPNSRYHRDFISIKSDDGKFYDIRKDSIDVIESSP